MGKITIGKLLFRIARLKILGVFVGIAFAYFPFLIPVRKIEQNKKVVAFRHPAASYPDHILIIPRKIARTMFHLSGEDFLEAIEMAMRIRGKDNADFVLVINGGKRQDVMQAHFHLFTGNWVASKGLCTKWDANFLRSKESIGSSLRNILKRLNVPEEEFSLVFQFENDADPAACFIL